MSDADKDLKRIEAACDSLTEHFDSVQIFATKYDASVSRDNEASTTYYDSGLGDWFARYGVVKQWVCKQEERFRRDDQESQ